jgi:hypothetical protein
MAYTRSRAQGGKGWVLNVITGTASAPVTTPVLEVDSITDGSKWETDDVTNFASAAVERISTMFDGGEWKVGGNRVTADAGQALAQGLYASGDLGQFTVVAPMAPGQTTAGDSWAFYALVTGWHAGKVDPKKKVPVEGTLATSNGCVFTPGS